MPCDKLSKITNLRWGTKRERNADYEYKLTFHSLQKDTDKKGSLLLAKQHFLSLKNKLSRVTLCEESYFDQCRMFQISH